MIPRDRHEPGEVLVRDVSVCAQTLGPLKYDRDVMVTAWREDHSGTPDARLFTDIMLTWDQAVLLRDQLDAVLARRPEPLRLDSHPIDFVEVKR